jgi:replicative DNA helicase
MKQPILNDYLSLGKCPPSAIDLEEIVLGSIMLEKELIFKAVNIIKPESFYKDAHVKIFAAMLVLFESKKPIDLLLVTEQLKKSKELDEVGGPYYISGLTQRVGGTGNFDEHCLIIANKYKKRELIRIAYDISNQSFDESIENDEILNYINLELFKLSQGENDRIVHIKDAISENLKVIEQLSKNEIKLSGIASGHTKLDRLTCGWQKGDLIILAGRPSMGKTALALEFGRNAAFFNCPVLFFSLEMSISQLANRYISSKTDYTNMELKTGRVTDWIQIEKCVKFFENINIYIDDSSGLNINQLRSRSYLLKNKFNIGMIIVDYLQLMKGFSNDKTSREQEISNISRNLKIIAKELNLPVMALSQLNRLVESRSGTKRPQLSDLRESGAIEQDADLVIFVNKPEKYGIMEYDDGTSTLGITEVIISKHRSGSVGEIKLRHNTGMSKFWDDYDEVIEFSEPDNKITANKDFAKENDNSPF